MSKKRNNLSIDVKVGILHTIADAIYSTQTGKIREAVANARDNEATWMIIIIDQATKSLFLFDNGTGISKKRFHEIFESIGYGLLKKEPEKKLSYFGLGLMSIFQLGKKVKVFTRPFGEKQLYKLEVNTADIFSKKNEDKSISSLKSITLCKSDESERASVSVPLLNQSLGKIQFKNSLKSFTEIIIENIDEDDLKTICEDSFVEDLRKILPLKPEKDEPFLNRFTGDKGKQIKKIIQDEEFCNTIDIHFGIQEDNSLEQLWKYFPAFRADLSFPDDNIFIGQSQDGNFAYYIIHSVAVDLHRSQEAERESGFWIRNQHFLVKSADFLERPGPGRKIKTIDEPLKGWIFGEIFHKDMNSFLAVSRNEFLFEKDEFKKFQQEIINIVSPLNQGLREIYKKRKLIVDGLIEPFSKLSAKDGAIAKTEQRLREMISPELDERAVKEKIFTQLRKIRSKEVENERLRIDKILKQKRTITLGEDKDALVRVDSTLKGRGQDFNVTWDAKNDRVIVSISPDLFEPKQVLFLGQEFTIYFVAGEEKTPGASIDVDSGKIYINPFNEDLTRYSISVFDVYIALQIADAISNGKKDLIKNTLVLLGVSSPIAQKYIAPLGDDLKKNRSTFRCEGLKMAESLPEVGGTIPALLVFADIVDSSRYSAVLGRFEYARRLIDFQKIFKTVGRKYFPEPPDPTQEFCEVNARGDEGTIFYATCMEVNLSDAVFRAIEFLYHLKGLLRYGSAEEENETSSPRQIGLGAGIHIGKVAFAVASESNRSIIKQIEGFDINYAKRVESCSRIGKYSHIFLSKDAAKLLEDRPIIFSRTCASMKGIEENAEVYEVQSGLFNGLKIDTNDNKLDEIMVEKIKELSCQPIRIEEPWNKALIISVLDCLLKDTIVSDSKDECQKLQMNLAWHSSIEDDPILLYLRAREYEKRGQYTQQLRYLKQITQEHPDFVHVKKRMIKSCWAITRKKPERVELIFARDIAKEFLDKFPHFLSDEEKKEFHKLIKAISQKTKSKK